MIRIFELSHHRRVKIWLDEVPPTEFSATSHLVETVRPKSVADVLRSRVGIEIRIPQGPYVSYGLLGAELVKSSTDGLEINISKNEDGDLFQTDMVSSPEEARIGLPYEYSNAVLRGVMQTLESEGGPAKGALNFRWAAHGLVGSSQSLFERLGRMVLQLLLLPSNVTDEQLRSLLE